MNPYDRMPSTYDALVEALDTAKWDRKITVSAGFRCADVVREVVEVQGATRGGHRVIAWFAADAPEGKPRPGFEPGGAIAGQHRGVHDTTIHDAIAYIREHPISS